MTKTFVPHKDSIDASRPILQKPEELPASEWLERVEARIGELSNQRQALRLEMKGHSPGLALVHASSERFPSPHRAWLQARASYLGSPWQEATELLRRSHSQIRTARRLLGKLDFQRQRISSSVAPWRRLILHAPRFILAAQPLKRRLAMARRGRREALLTIRNLRPLAQSPGARLQIARGAEELLLSGERLLLRRDQLLQQGKALSESIAEGLALASQLRTLGRNPVAMREVADPEQRQKSFPVPAHSLEAPPAGHRSNNRPRLG